MKATKNVYYPLRYIWKGHLANPFWQSRERRRARRKNEFEILQQSRLKDFRDFAAGITAPPAPESDGKEEEKIFCLWFQDEDKAPEIVKKCLARLREKYGKRVVFLNEKTLGNYITLPDFIMRKWRKKQIIPANFSDIVRIELLSRYGGYWFDATVFLTGEIPEVVENSDFFMYVASKRYFSRMFVQTCFMRARKGNPLLMMWRELIFEYWRRENKAIDYFLVHYLLKFLVNNNEEAAALFSQMPKIEQDPTHELWYKIGNDPFDMEKYREMTEKIFFQKCSYKKGSKAIEKIIPGSMADYVINSKI